MNSSVDELKVPPHSIEAEQAVLGGLLLDNSAWDKVADKIADRDFYRKDHRYIFAAIAHLAENQDPVDVVTCSEFLKRQSQLEDSGGLAYLGTLAKDTPSAANIEAYANIVREKSVLRQLVSVAGDISDSAFNSGRSSADVLDEAEQKIFQIAEKDSRSGNFQSINKLVRSSLKLIQERAKQEGGIIGTACGFTGIDEKTAGFRGGDLVIVAGRPAMGKTTISMNMAEHVALAGKPVAIFSMEMPAEQLVMRMLASQSRVPLSNVISGDVHDSDWPRLAHSVSTFDKVKLFIDESPGMTPTEIRAKCRRLHREQGELGLVVIDYLQLMHTGNKAENRATEISEISRNLKSLAKELDTPIIALSQLNRGLEQRPNKRPVMSDLRESGAIEQDADMIMFVYRDEVYNENSEHKGTAELIIGKHRNGPTGTVRLTFHGQYTRFDNMAHDYPESYN